MRWLKRVMQCLALLFLLMAAGHTADAAGLEKATVSTIIPRICQSNTAENYGYRYDHLSAYPEAAYLQETKQGYERVEVRETPRGGYDFSSSSSLVVEEYDKNYEILSAKEISLELPRFGGCYLGRDYNFVICGQENQEKDDTKEVIRVIKYSKEWERLDSTSVYGADTTIPFDFGKVSCAEKDGMLYVWTCHIMYNGHQSNMSLILDIGTMKLYGTDQDGGYVSHSLNQFILADGDDIITLDQGDAYPRAAVLCKFSNIQSEFVQGIQTKLLKFREKDIYQYTDAALGGLSASDSSYLAAGNYREEESDKNRSIFLSVVPKNQTENHQLIYLTDGKENVDMPKLVKIDSNRFLILWNVKNENTQTLSYVMVDGQGKKLTEVVNSKETADLSDCQPIVSGNKVVWYSTRNSVPHFYEIDIDTKTISVTDAHYNAAVADLDRKGLVIWQEHNLLWGVDSEGCLKITGSGDSSSKEWRDYSDKIKNAVVSVKEMTSCASMFEGLGNLVTVKFTDTDMREVKDMSHMFSGCKSLKEIEGTDWDTGNVTNMGNMFSGCEALEKLDVSQWNTGNVTNMREMFLNCKSLKELKVSDWDTSNVVDMYGVFWGCEALKKLDVSQWDTGNVVSIWGMFLDCKSLKELEVSDWDTENVNSMVETFWGCEALEKLDVSQWDTKKVTNMWGLFLSCKSLKELEVSDWDTGNVTNMNGMFWCCEALEELDVSQWNTDKVTDMGNMFYYCRSILDLDFGSWDGTGITQMDGMITGCDSLQKLVMFPNAKEELSLPEASASSYWEDENKKRCETTAAGLKKAMTYQKTGILEGDLDQDGSINSADALTVLKIAANLTVPTSAQKRIADVNQDGKINAADALLILKRAAGLITEF